MADSPVREQNRIESLDVLRGFALLGILLLNIVGFGLPAAAYSNPALGFYDSFDPLVWAGVDVFAEGAMRCLFSILFGAGVVLFATGERAKSGMLHYKRNFWLLLFGLFDAYVLLWNGDILVNYALAGALLYVVREQSPGRLLSMALVLVVMMSLMYAATQYGLSTAKAAALSLEAAQDPARVDAGLVESAAAWYDFAADFAPSSQLVAEELAARRLSYISAFNWNVPEVNGMLLFVLPVILFWDALAMMLLGMALYKYGILQGQRSRKFYMRLMCVGFCVGLLVNGVEVHRAFSHDFALLSVFAQAQATYHMGRLGMAMGYLGLIMLLVDSAHWQGLRYRLAAVGRMALTNYLMHSLLCLFIFTGAGLALVGTLSRWQLYMVVLAIWLLQLWLSPWWLRRFRFGPLEWLWRGLTYSQWPTLRRNVQVQ